MNLNPNTTSTYAILSLAFGIMAWIMAPLLGAIVAVVCGHLALFGGLVAVIASAAMQT